MENKAIEKESLTLKWGTLKAWSFHSDECTKLFKEYCDIGSSMSAMCQHDTPRQKEILCELIDKGNFKKVFLYWDGVWVSKLKAKKYVMEYGTK